MSIAANQILAKKIRTSQQALVIELEFGLVTIPWESCSPRLAAASAMERSMAELSPSGYGIHWSLLDEDLAVGPLVADRQAEPTPADCIK